MSKGPYRTIMLIDDDIEDCEIFIDAVREVDPDIQCQCQENGEIAISLLSLHAIENPDLFFVDLNMPKLNGKQVLVELKRNLPDIPVIMFSTFFGEQDINEIHAAGAAHHMIKHTNFNDLCKALEDVLSKKW